MNEKKSFRLVLPSNSSMKFYPENTLATFTTKLACEYNLSDEWSVALSNISYPTSWYTLSGFDEGLVQYRFLDDLLPDEDSEEEEEEDEDVEAADAERAARGEEFWRPKPLAKRKPRTGESSTTTPWPHDVARMNEASTRPDWSNFALARKTEIRYAISLRVGSPLSTARSRVRVIMGSTNIYAGHYRDLEALVDEIRNSVGLTTGNEDARGITMRYDSRIRRFVMSLKKGTAISLSPALSRILGFNKPLSIENLEYDPITITGDSAGDLHAVYYNVYVQVNLLEEQIVGDKMMNLLFILPMNQHDSAYVHHEVEHLQFVPLKQTTFDEITVRLVRDDGKPVPFESGKVVVTLEFRKDQMI